MIVFRILGWLLIACAAAVVAWEVLGWSSAGAYRIISLGELWFRLDSESLNLMQAVVQRYISEYAWDPVVQTALLWPAWAVLGVPGILLVLLFRSRRGGRRIVSRV